MLSVFESVGPLILLFLVRLCQPPPFNPPGAPSSVLEGGAFDFAFSCPTRLFAQPFSPPYCRSTLNFGRTLHSTYQLK